MQPDHKASLVISLDFELHWGVRDHRSVADYRKNLLGARQAIPQILALFQQYGIHATWATVGMLFFDKKSDLLAALPSRRPGYAQTHLSAYEELASIGDSEESDPFHYGASLIRMIRAVPGQELATHTFSHYFCLESGQTPEEFQADLECAVKVARAWGVELQSIVFPRNQVNPAYLGVVQRVGLRIYRGSQDSKLHEPGNTEAQRNTVRRALRLLDAYLPLTRLSAATTETIALAGAPYNVKASRFLRPYSRRLALLEPLRIRRIQREMTSAARQGAIYHLWWHPHNFGVRTKENLAALEQILSHFDSLRRSHGMTSRTMAEVAELCTSARAPVAFAKI